MTGSKRRKGNRSRLYAIRELEKEGWLVDVVEKTSKWAKIKDCFGLFDIIAIHQEKGIMLIQISTNNNHPHKAFQEFANKYSLQKITFTQWTWKDRKGFTKKEYGIITEIQKW